jgi:hypothetical protein
MIVRRYDHNTDYIWIEEWLPKWGLPVPTKGMLPKIGFVVEGIAMAFLEQPDTNSCYFENLYSNKDATKIDRDEAINLIVDEAIVLSRLMGFKRMLSTTDHPAMIVRAIKRGSQIEKNKVLIITHL